MARIIGAGGVQAGGLHSPCSNHGLCHGRNHLQAVGGRGGQQREHRDVLVPEQPARPGPGLHFDMGRNDPEVIRAIVAEDSPCCCDCGALAIAPTAQSDPPSVYTSPPAHAAGKPNPRPCLPQLLSSPPHTHTQSRLNGSASSSWVRLGGVDRRVVVQPQSEVRPGERRLGAAVRR